MESLEYCKIILDYNNPSSKTLPNNLYIYPVVHDVQRVCEIAMLQCAYGANIFTAWTVDVK